jgi:hypothetical protein
MRALLTIAVAGLGLASLSACQTQQVEASPPTVTYSHNSSDYDEVALQADEYCEQHYGLDARLVDRDRTGGGYQVTYACD